MSENYPDVDDDGRVPSEFGKPVEKEYCDYCKEVLAINKQLEQQKAFLISCIKSGERLEDDWENKWGEK